MDNRQLQSKYWLQCHKSRPCLCLDYNHQRPKEILQYLPNWCNSVHFLNQRYYGISIHRSLNYKFIDRKSFKNLPLAFAFMSCRKAEQNSFFGERKCSTSSQKEIITQVTNSFQSTVHYFWHLKLNFDILKWRYCKIPVFVYCCWNWYRQKQIIHHSRLPSMIEGLLCHHPSEIGNCPRHHLKYFTVQKKAVFVISKL